MSSCRLLDLPEKLEKFVYAQRSRILALQGHPMVMFKLADLLRETVRAGMTAGTKETEDAACVLPHSYSRVCALWYDGCHCEEPYDKEASDERDALRVRVAALEEELRVAREGSR